MLVLIKGFCSNSDQGLFLKSVSNEPVSIRTGSESNRGKRAVVITPVFKHHVGTWLHLLSLTKMGHGFSVRSGKTNDSTVIHTGYCSIIVTDQLLCDGSGLFQQERVQKRFEEQQYENVNQIAIWSFNCGDMLDKLV